MVSSRSISTGLPATFFFSILGTTRPPIRLDEPAPFLRIARIGKQRRDQRRSARRERPPRRPYMQRRYMPVPDILLMHGIQRRLLQRKPPLDEPRLVGHLVSLNSRSTAGIRRPAG